MTSEDKTQYMLDWIDNADYEELLTKWRFAPTGDPFFDGNVGKHFVLVIQAKKAKIGDAEHTRISKKIGW